MKKRIVRVPVNPEVLLSVFQQDAAMRVTQGIPKSAIFKGVTLDPITQNLYLFVEDDSFEEVNVETEVAPTLSIKFRKMH